MRKQTSNALRQRNLVTGAIIMAVYGSTFHLSALAAEAARNTQTPAQFAQIDEILVTAQKRTENIQSVPIAMSAMSGAMLAEKQVTSVADLAQHVPNMQFSQAGGSSASTVSFYIRGIGQFNQHATADPGVGIYFDNVYMARSAGANLDLGDIAQVEVLRGPQGTLFGRNTISGAVSITTNKPDFDFGGNADVSVGTIDITVARATLNVPIVSDKLASRFSFLGNIRDGYGTNTGPSGEKQSLGKSRRYGARGQLLWQASEDFEVLLAGDFMRMRGNSTPGGLTAFTPSSTSDDWNANNAVQVGPQWLVQGYDSFLYIRPDDDIDTAGASLTMTYSPDSVTIKSISSYRDLTARTGQDYGGVPVPWIAQQMYVTQWQISQELQATGALLDGDLKYTAGVYYFKESAFNDTYAALFGGNLYIPTRVTGDSIATYGQLTYNLTEKLSLTAGARWTSEHKTILVSTTLDNSVILPESSNSFRVDSTTPMANIKYQWTDELMTYASFAKGLRSGGFNAQPFSQTDLIPTEPEISTTYEVGAKMGFLDRRLRLNIAGFYNDYTNIQLGATTLVNDVFVFRNANAAKATIYGAEVEMTALLAPGLEATLGGSYLHSSISAVPGFSFGVSKLPSAPKFILDAGLSYEFQYQDYGTVITSADANFRTGAYPQFNPTPESRQGAYALVNARIIFEPKDSAWSFSIWGKNISNVKYEVFGQTGGSNDVTVGWFGRPREVGATAAVKF